MFYTTLVKTKTVTTDNKLPDNKTMQIAICPEAFLLEKVKIRWAYADHNSQLLFAGASPNLKMKISNSKI